VWGAVDALGAHRVQHGVRAIEDATLVTHLADREICLDVCPTSNLLLSVVADIESHPLPQLLATGVPCSINADDPLLFGVGLLDEYELCRSRLGLDDASLAACARSSIAHSGAPERVKGQGVAGIEFWLRDELGYTDRT
jgi:adenosine deaminase